MPIVQEGEFNSWGGDGDGGLMCPLCEKEIKVGEAYSAFQTHMVGDVPASMLICESCSLKPDVAERVAAVK